MKLISMNELHEEMRREHHRLEECVQGLRAALESRLEWSELSELIHDLQLSVYSHFAFEESGGYMAEIVRQAPHEQQTVDRLIEEHRSLRSRMSEICAAIETESAQTRVMIEEWIAAFARHEEDENLLVQRVFLREFGGGD